MLLILSSSVKVTEVMYISRAIVILFMLYINDGCKNRISGLMLHIKCNFCTSMFDLSNVIIHRCRKWYCGLCSASTGAH